jgi:hypothetical protein
MLAQLSARLLASQAAGMQVGDNGLGVQVEGGRAEDDVARLVLGDECLVM